MSILVQKGGGDIGPDHSQHDHHAPSGLPRGNTL
jgi:hypothetical protein